MSTPKMIPVSAWAASRYDPPPSDWILRKWCREGQIHPMPERVGKEWRVREDARRLTADAPRRSLLEQLGAA